MKIEFDMKENTALLFGIFIVLLTILYVNYQHWQTSELLYVLMNTEVGVENNVQPCELKNQAFVHLCDDTAAIKIESQQVLQEMLQSNQKPSVLFFHMNNCGWCKKMDPIYEEVLKNTKFAGINFYKIEGDRSGAPMLIKQMFNQQITGYPTLIFIKDGKYVDKQVGFSQLEQFEQKITETFCI